MYISNSKWNQYIIFIFIELVKNGSYRGYKNKFISIEPYTNCEFIFFAKIHRFKNLHFSVQVT